MGRVSGKVALVTGAARGQGRAHALRLAEEGADIIAFDLCAKVEGSTYDGATEADLAETVELVERLDRRVLAQVGDLRNLDEVQKVVRDGVQEMGKIDVLIGNAGVTLIGVGWEISEEDWATQIDINLTGTWRMTKEVIPHMIEAGNGGSIVLTSSGAVDRSMGNLSHYSASKYGVEGMCGEFAVELAPHNIRINTVRPTSVHTIMFDHQAGWELFTPDMEGRPLEERRQGAKDIMSELNMLNVPWVEPVDIANGALFLASDEARMITGTALRVDAGFGRH